MNSLQIEDAHFGTTPVMKIFQGLDLIWPLNEPIGPGPDILLDWISNGTSLNSTIYFDTKYNPTELTQVEIKYSYHSAVNNTALFGTTSDAGLDYAHPTSAGYSYRNYSYMLRGPYWQSTASIKWASTFNFGRFGYNYVNSASYISNPAFTHDVAVDTPHIMRITPLASGYTTMTFDGTLLRSISGGSSSSKSIYMFALNDEASNGPACFAPADTRIYYMKIYDNTFMLYRNYIPVLHYDTRRHRYVPCFFDKVSNTYLYKSGYGVVGYQIKGDYSQNILTYLLDYIERDDSGYLTYMTGVNVADKLLTNLGFTVCDSSTSMTSLQQNLVAGARYNSSNKYGLLFPAYDSSTTFGFIVNNTLVNGTYSYSDHSRETHHSDHIAMLNTSTTALTRWLEFQDGVLPSANTSLRSASKKASAPSEGLLSREIGLFGDDTMHAQKSTKIFYYDVSDRQSENYNSNTYVSNYPLSSYIPVYYNNTACFYDLVHGNYIFNTGVGEPAYEMLNYEGVIPDTSPGDSSVIIDSSADILLNWISNGNASAQPNVFFNTGFIPSNTTQVEIKFSYSSIANNSALFGVFDNDTFSKEYTFMLRGSTHNNSVEEFKTTFYYGKTGYSAQEGAFNGAVIDTPSFNDAHTMRFTSTGGHYDRTTVYFDGNVKEADMTPYSMTPGIDEDVYHYSDGLSNIYLFAANDIDNSVPARFASADTKVYYVKIYNGQAHPILYRFLIPVLHYDSSVGDYVPCFYDKVSGTYFYNQGTDDITYEIKGDYLLDYIERRGGTLSFITNTYVENYDVVNIAMGVGDIDISMTSLKKNIIAGARYNNDNRYGLYFPLYDSSTTYGVYGPGNVASMTYDSSGHTFDSVNHFTYTTNIMADTTWSNGIYYLNFQDGDIPTLSNSTLTHKYSYADTYSNKVLGCRVGLFTDMTELSQATTRIHYYDAAKLVIYDMNNLYSYHQPKCSYIPVVHNNIPCFYNITTNGYIYNRGTGNPGIATLGG